MLNQTNITNMRAKIAAAASGILTISGKMQELISLVDYAIANSGADLTASGIAFKNKLLEIDVYASGLGIFGKKSDASAGTDYVNSGIYMTQSRIWKNSYDNIIPFSGDSDNMGNAGAARCYTYHITDIIDPINDSGYYEPTYKTYGSHAANYRTICLNEIDCYSLMSPSTTSSTTCYDMFNGPTRLLNAFGVSGTGAFGIPLWGNVSTKLNTLRKILTSMPITWEDLGPAADAWAGSENTYGMDRLLLMKNALDAHTVWLDETIALNTNRRFYLSSTGSNTIPYDTEETAATSIWNIRSNINPASSDIIELCNDVTETTFDGATYGRQCNIIAKSGLPTRPKLIYNIGSNGPMFNFANITEDISIENIEYISDNAAAPDVNSGSNTYKTTFKNCIIRKVLEDTGAGIISANNINFENCLIIGKALGSPIIVDNFGNIIQCTLVDLNDAPGTPAWNGGFTQFNHNIVFSSGNTENSYYIPTPSNWTCSGLYGSNNIYYGIPGSGITLFSTNGINLVNNTNIDPLFLETDTYMLSTVSPAINSSLDGINIGWDITTQHANSRKGIAILSQLNQNQRLQRRITRGGTFSVK